MMFQPPCSGVQPLGEPVLIVSLLVALYLTLGLTFAAYNDGDLVLETIGRVVGLSVVVITFPYWLFRVARAEYINRVNRIA